MKYYHILTHKQKNNKNDFNFSKNVIKYVKNQKGRKVMEQEVNSELREYMQEKIFPIYNKNEKGHGIEHIQKVIKRSLKFAKEQKVNLDMAYTIAGFHDIGHHIDRKKHEQISAEIFMKDENMKRFFTEEQRKTIKEAIEDHRASSDHEPRSIYGKIVSTADRTIDDIECTIKRAYSYEKNSYKEKSHQEIKEGIYKHLKEKYGLGGYSKVYLKDEEYEESLKMLRKAIENKETFMKMIDDVMLKQD